MIEHKALKRICPICGCSRGAVLHTQRFLLPEGHLLPNHYDVVSCTDCGFVFADTTANQAMYDRYYAEMSKYEDVHTASGGGDNTYDLSRLNQMADDIERIVSTNKEAAILDIGCGNGGLLHILNQRGYKQVVGLDPSEACVSTMRKKGIEAYQGGLFSEKTLDKTFDVIVLSHVLEHIYDVANAVTNLKTYLKPGGLVYAETPNATKYPAYYIVPNYYFDTEHINHFSGHHLQNLFERYGYTAIEHSEKEVMVTEKQAYPAIFSVFQYNGTSEDDLSRKPRADYSLNDAIKHYIELSEKDNRTESINELYASQAPVIIWGAGNYTLRLLVETNLGKCNILHFIDSDSKKWNQTIHGKPILSPVAAHVQNKDVIVCSALFAAEIQQQLQQLNPGCRTILL